MSDFIYRQHRGHSALKGLLWTGVSNSAALRQWRWIRTHLLHGFDEWMDGLLRSSFTSPYDAEGLRFVFYDEHAMRRLYIDARWGSVHVSLTPPFYVGDEMEHHLKIDINVGHSDEHPGGYFYKGAAEEFVESPIFESLKQIVPNLGGWAEGWDINGVVNHLNDRGDYFQVDAKDFSSIPGLMGKGD